MYKIHPLTNKQYHAMPHMYSALPIIHYIPTNRRPIIHPSPHRP